MVMQDVDVVLVYMVPFIIGFILDKVLGDPLYLPHPVVGFGKLIHFFEKRLNKGRNIKFKGALTSLFLISAVFALTYLLVYFSYQLSVVLGIILSGILVFFCLAGKTLIDEVRMVFQAVDRSLEEGRKQVGRIVGRDTSELSADEIRTAALETLAENLSDGVIAPMFWFAIAGVPGMLAYKMVNTLDSMIGYKNERYRQFGCWAAHIDDIANYIPSRITALLMVVASGRLSLLGFVARYGKCHASPNSGYPESALAGILNCRFGGPHSYFGEIVYKPYIGYNDRELTTNDMYVSVKINRIAEYIMVVLVCVFQYTLF